MSFPVSACKASAFQAPTPESGSRTRLPGQLFFNAVAHKSRVLSSSCSFAGGGRERGQQRTGQPDIAVLRRRHAHAEDLERRHDQVCLGGEAATGSLAALGLNSLLTSCFSLTPPPPPTPTAPTEQEPAHREHDGLLEHHGDCVQSHAGNTVSENPTRCWVGKQALAEISRSSLPFLEETEEETKRK